MATSPLTQTAPNAAQPPTPSGTDALAKLSGDYTMFLKLLTSQMTNQDPLDPMDTSQYTQQLVQYSQVEQSIQQSGTLKEILARLSGQDMIQASSLIGRTASFSGPTTGLSAQAPAHWTWTSERPVTTLSATIVDGAGKTVDSIALDPASGRFDWDGTLGNGRRAPDGAYTLTLSALDASGNAIATTIGSTGTVQSVSLAGNELSLMVNGAAQNADALIAVGTGP